MTLSGSSRRYQKAPPGGHQGVLGPSRSPLGTRGVFRDPLGSLFRGFGVPLGTSWGSFGELFRDLFLFRGALDLKMNVFFCDLFPDTLFSRFSLDF